MTGQRDLFEARTDEKDMHEAPATVTGYVTGDGEAESQPSESESIPNPANKPQTEPDAGEPIELQTDEDESTPVATFEGRISDTPNTDGSRDVAGEIHYECSRKQASSSRQSRSRQRKKEKGLERVEVWVPKGTEQQVRELAAAINEEHGTSE